jgi:polar amino acid transport system substrate-binding protein
MPAGSYMNTIQRRGRLVVGVDQNTLFFGYRDPFTGDLDGFDIALAREIARAIFGNPNAIVFRTVTTAQRLDVVEDGDVDLTASQVTAICTRRVQADLSSVYYNAHQKLMVRKDGPINSVSDLAGRKVCATTGSTSLDNIEKLAPKAIPYPVPARTDCLVALQQGWVDAVTSDDTILLGLAVQDPADTKILPADLSNEPYTLATSNHHPEFGRFVNGVLDQLRSDGRLEQLYHQYLNRPDVGFFPPVAPPPAAYKD